MAFLYGVYIVFRCTANPTLAPSYQVSAVPLAEKLSAFFKYVLPLTSIVFLVVGLIFLGVATPTEAAAMGSVGSLVLAALYRSLDLKVARKAVTGALEVTVMTFMIIAGSITFSQILANDGALDDFRGFHGSDFHDDDHDSNFYAGHKSHGVQPDLVRHSDANQPGDRFYQSTVWAAIICHERGCTPGNIDGRYLPCGATLYIL